MYWKCWLFIVGWSNNNIYFFIVCFRSSWHFYFISFSISIFFSVMCTCFHEIQHSIDNVFLQFSNLYFLTLFSVRTNQTLFFQQKLYSLHSNSNNLNHRKMKWKRIKWTQNSCVWKRVRKKINHWNERNVKKTFGKRRIKLKKKRKKTKTNTHSNL